MNFKPLFYFHVARTKAGTLSNATIKARRVCERARRREKNNKTSLTNSEKHISQNMIRKLARKNSQIVLLNSIKFLQTRIFLINAGPPIKLPPLRVLTRKQSVILEIKFKKNRIKSVFYRYEKNMSFIFTLFL